MYALSEQQIDFIRNDIGARGIGMVSLQQDLLDHICCVIEHELEADGDFERFYSSVIPRFYKSELKEIEEETITLLTNKNYYTMKKIMIGSGAASVVILSLGIFLKFMHLPGAAATIFAGLVLFSLVFLPLMFTLRIKEKQENREKVVTFIGGISGMLISMGVLFKVMHWPGANMMCMVALLLMLVVFIPVYFFTGLRNPATKVNTVVSSILMFTGCILILTLIRRPAATREQYVNETAYFFQNEQIVKTEKAQLAISGQQSNYGDDIFSLCEDLKSYILEKETGFKSISSDFESKNALIGETWANDYFKDSPAEFKKLDHLKSLIETYNQTQKLGLPFKKSVFDLDEKVGATLNSLVQIQMVVLQNQRQLVAMK